MKTDLIEVFDFWISEYNLISNLCQDIMLIIYEETKNIINYKFEDILKCVNLEKITSKDRNFLILWSFFSKKF